MVVLAALPTEPTPLDVATRKRKHDHLDPSTTTADPLPSTVASTSATPDTAAADKQTSPSADYAPANDRKPSLIEVPTISNSVHDSKDNPSDANGHSRTCVHDDDDHDHDHDDDDDDDDDDTDDSNYDLNDNNGSYLEEILDTLEENPYVHSDSQNGLSVQEGAALRAMLREIGIERFFTDVIFGANQNPRCFGPAFGIDPNLAISDEYFLRLLSLSITRAFYRRHKLPQFNTIDDAVQLLKSSRKIMIITGAGISTSLGIPDFRSKKTGFYEMIRNEGLSEGEEVFDIHNFDEDPSTFYRLARHILPDMDRCSPTHAFIRLLQDQERLQTNYTQNIDNIEAIAGIDEKYVIQCHGSFRSATCRKCQFQVPGTDIFEDIRAERVALCKRCVLRLAEAAAPPPPPKRKRVSHDDASDSDTSDSIPQAGVMKPDITFFGEQLPDTFFQRFTDHDAQNTDLVIVIGTSLKVAPVSEMPNYIPHTVPHIYISKEPIGHVEFDIQLLGQCDHIVAELCRRAGWTLNHDLISPDFHVDVLPVADRAHHWLVQPPSTDAAPNESVTVAA